MSHINPKPLADYPWYLRWMFRRQIKNYGQVLIPTQTWGRVPVLLRRFLAMFRAFERTSSPIDPTLRALITVRVSQINHCAFCVDFNSMRVLNQCGDQAKLDALAQFADSPLYSPKEKAALAYAEAMTFSDRVVDLALVEQVKAHFDADAVVDLTGLIAFQNMSSKFNAALDLPAQGLCRMR